MKIKKTTLDGESGVVIFFSCQLLAVSFLTCGYRMFKVLVDMKIKKTTLDGESGVVFFLAGSY